MAINMNAIIVMIACVGIITAAYGAYQYIDSNKPEVIYCSIIEELNAEQNVIEGMKCSTLRFEYESIGMDFSAYLMNISAIEDHATCGDSPIEACDGYDAYFYNEKAVDNEEMKGNVRELIGMRYEDTDELLINRFNDFFVGSTRVSYQEGQEMIVHGRG